MIEGMYTAAAGMAAQQVRLDAVANDLANANTTAYKSNRVAFRDLLYQAPGRGAAPGIEIGSGSAATAIGRNMSAGSFQQTGRPLDVALTGPGFIQVRLSNGEKALTRDGNLSVQADGRLALASGELLEPRVQLPKNANESDVTIGIDGSVNVRNTKVGQIKLVEVRSPGQLLPSSNNTFTVSAGSGAASAAKNTTFTAGVLESSNMDTSSAMVAMIESQRAFQLASRAVKIQDQVWEIANQVKRNV
jgi:flagellar basal-body rod protein FlgG